MIHRRTLALGLIGALALVSASAIPASAHSTQSASYASGRTTVVLNPALVPTLVDTLKVGALSPGRLTAPGGVAQVSFPITRVKNGVVSHVGGLRFTPVGGGELRITKFDVNLNTGYLTAKTRLNGTKLPGRVNIFALGPVQAINGAVPACAGVAAGLTLTADAANALGAPSFTGAFVGDACVVPATHHGDHD